MKDQKKSTFKTGRRPVSTRIHPYYLSFEKRLFDVIFACVLLVALIPVFFLISIFLLVSNGSPLFYIQSRQGYKKSIFKIYKFRTMYVGAERDQKKLRQKNQAPYPMFKIFIDPRYVGPGYWLAKTGLDELPQLINIIMGEMSFVGPRPLPVNEAEKLTKQWDFRYSVKPGLFSEWSVSAEKHSSLKKWLMLERGTVCQGGLQYELKIIIKTLLNHFFLSLVLAK